MHYRGGGDFSFCIFRAHNTAIGDLIIDRKILLKLLLNKMGCINLDQDRSSVQWRFVMNTVMNLQVFLEQLSNCPILKDDSAL